MTARLAFTILGALLLAGPAGCAQFGVPAVSPELAGPPWPPTAVYLVYDPHTVLGLGHTGVIVPAPPGEAREAAGAPSPRWLRFDQYASAELAYHARVQAGTVRFWQAVTLRLPSIFGFTREVVLRREGASPPALATPREWLLPLPGLDAAAVRQAAEMRHAAAADQEAPGAPRYGWTFNNCLHFVRDVLRAGGVIHERYFPKHFVRDYLAGPP